MMFGALIWVAGLGALDGISFAVKGLLRRLIPGSRLNSEDNESYYEYIQKKRAKKTRAYMPLVIVGAVYTVFAIIFIILFYQVF